MKKLLLIVVSLLLLTSCGKSFEGRWSNSTHSSNSWVFDLHSDGSADVKCGPFEYSGDWVEDDGAAVISGIGETRAFFFAHDGLVYAYDHNDNINYTGIRVSKNK